MRKRVLKQLPNAGEIAHRLRIQTIDAFCAVAHAPDAGARALRRAARDRRGRAGALPRRRAAHARRALAGRRAAARAPRQQRARGLAPRRRCSESRDRWLRKTGAAPTRAELEAASRPNAPASCARARALHPKASPSSPRQPSPRTVHLAQARQPGAGSRNNETLRRALRSLLCTCRQRALRRRPVGGARRDPRAPAARRRAPEGGVRRARRDRLHRDRARRACARSARPTTRPTSCSRSTRGSSTSWSTSSRTPRYSQYELLERLTAGWEPGDGRTLFLVGDPMQSIYRFREAKVALFLQAKGAGPRQR